jgi:hypothetical protein
MRVLAVLGVLFMSATGAAAQAPAPRPPTQEPANRPDFLFGRPTASLGLKGSWVFARAGSDVFDFVQDQFTIDKGAFNARGLAVDLAFPVYQRVEVVAGVEFNRAAVDSEYRRFVDNNRLPIRQTTSVRARVCCISTSVRSAISLISWTDPSFPSRSNHRA